MKMSKERQNNYFSPLESNYNAFILANVSRKRINKLALNQPSFCCF